MFARERICKGVEATDICVCVRAPYELSGSDTLHEIIDHPHTKICSTLELSSAMN